MNLKIYHLTKTSIISYPNNFYYMKMSLFVFLICFLVGGTCFAQRDKDAQKSAREANRAYKDKDYHAAILHAVEALKGDLNKKGLKDANEVLSASYKVYLPTIHDQVERYEGAVLVSYNGRKSLEEALFVRQSYISLIQVHAALNTLPASILNQVGIVTANFKDYQVPLEAATTRYNMLAARYASECYEEAQRQLATDTKRGAFKAYHLLQEIKLFDSNFKDITQELNQAYASSQYRIAFVEFGTKFTMPVTSLTSSNGLSVSSSAFDFVTKNPYPNFVKIERHYETFDLWLNAGNIQAIHNFCVAKGYDGVVFGSYEIPNGSSVNLPVESKEVEKEVVVSETTTKGADGKEVVQQQKQKVKGVRHSYTREHKGDVTGQVYFYDAVQGKFVLNRFVIKGETYFRESWERGTGDLRVFSEREQKRFRDKDPDPTPPGDMQIGAISDFGSRVYAKFIETLPSLYE
jgi:hypothetical protein